LLEINSARGDEPTPEEKFTFREDGQPEGSATKLLPEIEVTNTEDPPARSFSNP